MGRFNITKGSLDSSYRILELNGSKDDVLDKHTVSHKALLIVRCGNIIYSETEGSDTTLSAGDIQIIPANRCHMLKCTEDAKAFLLILKDAKLNWKK